MDAEQQDFEPFAAVPGSPIYVSDAVLMRTQDGHRVVSVHGVVFAQYEVCDREREAYTMIALCECGYANQKQVAQAFGFTTRSVRRYQERFQARGIGALMRAAGRPVGTRVVRSNPRKVHRLERSLLDWKAQGLSNRAIAGKFGVSEKAIRKRLRRLGWQPQESASSLFPEEAAAQKQALLCEALSSAGHTPEVDGLCVPVLSCDHDPLDRAQDRALAALGQLDDAMPLFAPASHLPRAGVLLAIPALVGSEVLSIAGKLYGNIAPAFYGLRTTLVAFIVLALLRIQRPENLKEYVPQELGRIVGLDRMLEVKTLRRKLTRLALHRKGQDLGRQLAQRQIEERGQMMGFLYIDGHVRTYHGHHRIAKGYDTRRRLAVPATTDYWINDRSGDPLFVVTAEANAAMTRMLEPILKEARVLLGDQRRATVVFDRGGWSAKLFVKLLAMDFDILTYRKGRSEAVPRNAFALRTGRIEGRDVEYLLSDQPVHLLQGKLRLRQVTRLKDETQQSAILTSRWDLPDIEVAYRMFDRWRQENFFKYLRQEYMIDGLVDYAVEPDDPRRSVPNPARQAADRALRHARTELRKLQQSYGAAALTTHSQVPSFEQEKIRIQVENTLTQIEKLRDQQQCRISRDWTRLISPEWAHPISG